MRLDQKDLNGKLRAMKINYSKGCVKLREAFFRWKRETRYHKEHQVMAFAAGYNAALADMKKESKLTAE